MHSLSRRSLLAGAAVVVSAVAVGCTDNDRSQPEPSPDPDQEALLAALAREDELLAAYAAAGADAGPLAENVVRHELHRARLLELLATDGTTAATPGESATPPTAGGADLAALEDAAATAGRAAAGNVQSADLAALLASIAAAEAAHSAELAT